MGHAQHTLTLTLAATDANNDPLTFSAQVLPINGQPAAVAVSVLSKQLTIKPSQSIRYIAFNTRVKPLDNVNMRRAIIAATNKVALRTTRGGPAIGVIATHMIPPQMPGFQAAGGTGATVDFEQHPGGDLALAMKVAPHDGHLTFFPSMFSGTRS